MQQEQELEADKKRRILQVYLNKLMKSSPNLYYSPTADVARELHLLLKEHKNRMPVDEQLLFKNLSVRDVEVMLSFH